MNIQINRSSVCVLTCIHKENTLRNRFNLFRTYFASSKIRRVPCLLKKKRIVSNWNSFADCMATPLKLTDQTPSYSLKNNLFCTTQSVTKRPCSQLLTANMYSVSTIAEFKPTYKVQNRIFFSLRSEPYIVRDSHIAMGT